MKTDEYGTVINHNDTFAEIAHLLETHPMPLFFAWTDGHGTQLDILMRLGAEKFGPVQGGLKADDLFVAVMRKGAFGFAISNTESSPSYIGEKLNLGGHNDTTAELAELMNGVRRELK